MPLVQLPSIDIHQPLPIPILAQPVKDRASLAEPEFEASLDAALQAFTPVRDQPVPFTPLNLPDPFENVRLCVSVVNDLYQDSVLACEPRRAACPVIWSA